jgi:hypothetical protein
VDHVPSPCRIGRDLGQCDTVLGVLDAPNVTRSQVARSRSGICYVTELGAVSKTRRRRDSLQEFRHARDMGPGRTDALLTCCTRVPEESTRTAGRTTGPATNPRPVALRTYLRMRKPSRPAGGTRLVADVTVRMVGLSDARRQGVLKGRDGPRQNVERNHNSIVSRARLHTDMRRHDEFP